MFIPSDSQQHSFEATVFDVGQGTAVVMRSQHAVVVYDTGARYPSGFAPFEHTALPWLKGSGISTVDLLFLSHDDIDHTGGEAALQKALAVNLRVVGQSQMLSSGDQLCAKGQAWQAGELRLSALSGSEGENDNEMSCVLLVESKNCRFLLAGDIGATTEAEIISELKANHGGSQKPIHWLLAAHHGSRYSSTDTFLRYVKPEHIVFSSGYLNRFNHPHPDVLSRAQAVGAESHRTDLHGAIRLWEQDGKCLASRWRDQRLRFWSRY